MCLKRRAILVACDPDNNLKCITEDLGNWYCSLQEPYCGGWDSYEITILSYDNAKVSSLREVIKLADENEDYLLFVFSGHGGIIRNQSSEQTMIQLQDGLISENELCNIDLRCQRKTLFFDCCRNIVNLPSIIRRKAAKLTDKDVAKLMYFWLLSISSEGIVRIYSAQKDEVAQDNPSFTQYFFKAVNRLINCIMSDNYLCYSTYDTFKEAIHIFPKYKRQHPEYSTINNGQQFPFIINPYIQIEDLLKRIHF